KERWRKYRTDNSSLFNVIKGIVRLVHEPNFAKTIGWERDYIYFQDFIPNNIFVIRLIVINKKAFGLKRLVRENDFRASGSSSFEYSGINKEVLTTAFEISNRLNLKCVAFDFIYSNETPLIVEISYGFGTTGSSKCPGYWDKDLNWHEGKFNPQSWIVESLINKIPEDSFLQ